MSKIHKFGTKQNNTISAVSSNDTKNSNTIIKGNFVTAGSGSVSVSGTNTTDADIPISVSVVGSGSPELLPISTNLDQPLSGIAYTGADDTFTIVLREEAIDAKAATAVIGNTTFQAVNQGVGGNSITVSQDTSGLVFTQIYTHNGKTLKSGSSIFDSIIDYGGGLSADGSVPPNAKRISFANDPSTVYSQFRVLSAGRTEYRLSPPLAVPVPKGTAVNEVTGSTSITITDGTTTETITGITTEDDAVRKITEQSSLISPASTSLSNSFLNVGTQPRISNVSYDGNFEEEMITNIVAQPSAALSSYVIKVNRGVSPASFSITDSSGTSTTVLAGASFSDANVSFDLNEPTKRATPPVQNNQGFSVSYTSRTDGEIRPSIGVKPIVSGLKAVSKTIKFVYSKRPPLNKDYRRITPSGNLKAECLGVPITSSGSDVQASLVVTAGVLYQLIERTDDALPLLSLDILDTDLQVRKVDFFVQIIAAIDSAIKRAGGNAAALTQLEALATNLLTTEFPDGANSLVLLPPSDSYIFIQKVTCQAETILVNNGIFPDGLSGASCWTDDRSTAYWWVPEKETYLPAFSNRIYHSAKASGDGVVSTQEFAFAILVDGIAKVGDTVTISINGANIVNVENDGASASISVQPGSPVTFAGGIDENVFELWNINNLGSSIPFLNDTTGGSSYVGTDLSFTLPAGKHKVGDFYRLTFSSISASIDIDGVVTTGIIADTTISGFSFKFSSGQFFAGDVFNFTSKSSYSSQNLLRPEKVYFESSANSASVSITAGSSTLIAIGGCNCDQVTFNIGGTPQAVTVDSGVAAYETTIPFSGNITISMTGQVPVKAMYIYSGTPDILKSNASAQSSTLEFTKFGAIVRSFNITFTNTMYEEDVFLLQGMAHKNNTGIRTPVFYLPSETRDDICGMVYMPERIEYSHATVFTPITPIATARIFLDGVDYEQ